ncbi:uncharacterized protein BDZ99DRAFT_45539 [Mytilinidion resinicola]|uniref:Uncharacterized protein n=1 Tax=Mytilinidion resinicola TaxID=574789 RepID=A0A6A6YM92_9PEZI|nr:uncharacterized protein BDZ99DRAFT_45539 [Mytilinidion resinicola]KAF2809104.1 hypothetical protein BDZ99DRAFT_45539 [Mytilinidion resinicola]
MDSPDDTLPDAIVRSPQDPAPLAPAPHDLARPIRFSLINVSEQARAFIGNFSGDIINIINKPRELKRKKEAIAIVVLVVSVGVIVAILFGAQVLPSHTPTSEEQSMSTMSLWYTATVHDAPVPTSGSAYVSVSALSRSSLDSSQKDLESSRDTNKITILGPPAFVSAQTTFAPGSETQQPEISSTLPSTKETVFAAAVTSFSPSLTSSDPPRTTSILFGATGPVKTYLWNGTTTLCTRWSGLGCPGDQCYSNTCLDPLPCWEGRCCTSGCAEGWECTRTCVSAMSCVTTTGDSTGTCRYTA